MTTIDQVIAAELSTWYIDGKWPIGNLILCAIALALCFVLCGSIGLEREKRGRTAGLRTHLLVGIGSCMLMIISIYGFPIFKDEQGNVLFHQDIARLAAQVVAGVGFLGAGAIIHRNSGARGLTTAATIWIVMAIGLACGSFNFILAIGGTVIILVFLTLFKRAENKLSRKNPMIIVHTAQGNAIIGPILNIANDFDSSISELRTEIGDDGFLEITFMVMTNNEAFEVEKFISKIELVEGVRDVGVLNGHKF
ncbi:MAG: MgtC/SapB family protein [Bacilli bacterium]|nr:MgtC/SapB family protein [Bacilli bacterium]